MERLKIRAAKPRAWLLTAQRFAPYAAAAGAGFLLAGARFMEAPLPAAVCLMAALGSSLPSLLCYIGAVLGSFLLWDTTGMLLTLACGFLTLIIHWAMEDLPASASPWFLPLSVLLPGMLAGGLLLVSEPLSMRSLFIFVVQMAYLPMGAMAAKRVLKEPEGMALCAALFSFISGCGRIFLPGDVSIGAVLACAAVLWLGNGALVFPAAALMGLALDWSWQIPLSCGAALTAAAVGASLFSEEKKWLRCGAFLVTLTGVIALSGGGGGLLFLAAVGGCGVFLCLPPCPAALGASREAARSLRLAAYAMERLYRQLEQLPQTTEEETGEDICRMAAERVCVDCENKARCWTDGGETFHILLDAWPMLSLRGTAQEEDFPNRFRIRCHRLPRLLGALEDALHAKAERLQRSRHRRELRAAVGGQYRILGDFLRRCADFRHFPPPKGYEAEAALRQKRKRGTAALGDRALCWEQNGICRLLLCDGMGTGQQAAEAAGEAIGLMKTLLKAGMAADDAMETLNAAAILREDGGFSTVDLVEVSLATGEGMLYKWGGAPSFLLTEQGTAKIGTASLPPGLGVGGTHQPQQIRLSLGRGEVLILTSDGIDGEVVEAVLRQGESLSAGDLAAEIVARGCTEGEDDGTAAVLKLHSVSAR